jgi:hypothetical protein
VDSQSPFFAGLIIQVKLFFGQILNPNRHYVIGGGWIFMPKFLAIHPLPAPATIEQVTPIGKAAKASSTVDAYWVRSWAQMDENGKVVKILCEWNASNIEAVRTVLAKVQAPLEGIYPMMVVDSEDFR